MMRQSATRLSSAGTEARCSSAEPCSCGRALLLWWRHRRWRRTDPFTVGTGEDPVPQLLRTSSRDALRDRQVLLVHVGVVIPAEQDAVVRAGAPLVVPPDAVVDLALPGRRCATRVLAVSVAGDDRSRLCRSEQPLGTAGVQDLPVAPERPPPQLETGSAPCPTGPT